MFFFFFFFFFFSQGELVNNIERNVATAAEYVEKSTEETFKAVAYKKNPYKIAFRPNFFKNFKRNGASKTAADQSTSDLNHNWAPDPV
uniref:t-SNARE coiled-coil homology domain-containing protein n=1 Tax=Amphilophus citrinellus TaxID=61819 RepID=A0A3Q0RH40_AMPCI